MPDPVTANPSTAAAQAALPPTAAPIDNRWEASAADRQAFASGPVIAALTDARLLEFDGADSVPFLQGQTTIDVAALGEQAWQLGGYCTPKGRLLGIFQAWRAGSCVRLLLPASIAAGMQRRLGMYVLRAKVKIRDASADWSIHALFGAGSGAALAAAGLALPADTGSVSALSSGGSLVRLAAGPGAAERFVLLLPAGTAAPALAGVAPVGVALSWWSQIDAGVPAIVAGTQELFVPQAVNLEVLGGVNFRKGCYPGQEIVARSQYLGKLRRRLFLAHSDALGAGADIVDGGSGEPVGRIVLAASAPAGGWDLLFECPTDRAASGGLHAGGADAPPLVLRSLPYELFDPTA